MRYLVTLSAVAAVLLLPGAPLQGQTAGTRTVEERNTLLAAHSGDFDYLIGDWEFTTVSREYGRNRGRWGVVRLATGQILDEYRILGDSGETYYVTTTLRNYNSAMDRWELIGTEPGSGLLDFGTARWTGSEMHIEQRFGVAGGTGVLMRIRYYNIHPDRFSWTGDRSTDDGKTWERGYLTIEARRIGPGKTLGALAAPGKPE